MNNSCSIESKQQGAALLVFAIIVLTISSAAFFYSTNSTMDASTQAARKSLQSLAQAKQKLEQLSLSFMPSTALNRNEIGRLPFPDNRFDGVYDGYADCLNYSSSLTNLNLFLGQFPWLGTQNCFPEININSDLRDANGSRLWYAVSPYMVDNINNTWFNPSLLVDSPSLPNWLSIYNYDGTLISDRVAFIVFSSGAALSGQNRSNTNPRNFLDTLNVPGVGVINNFDNDLVFVKAPSSETFNDLLIYMTIDQLMPKLEKRVLTELRSLLVNYQANPAHPFYPLPATLGGTDCDLTIQTGGGGFIASTDLAATPCNRPLLSIPSYLQAWLPFIIYEPRRDCNQNIQTGCNGQANGLTLNDATNLDFTLISTGFNAPLDPVNRAEYLEDDINQVDNQIFITPTAVPSIYRDQLIFR